MDSTVQNQIKDQHIAGYKGISLIYDSSQIKESRPFICSFFTAIFLLILINTSNKSLFDVLIFWSDTIISIFPNIIGFTLGGFAIIVGFGNTDMLRTMTKPLKNKNYSIFQKLCAIFAFSLLLQLSTILFSYLIKYIIFLEINIPSIPFCTLVNSIVIFIISFMGIWSLTILASLTVNIFNLGQMHHFLLVKSNLPQDTSN